MNAKWKIISVVGLTAFLTCAYEWGIPAAINLPARKTDIETQIFQKTGYNLKLGKAKLSMGSFPSVWIKSNNITLLNKDNSKALSIDNPRVKLRLFPLLFKKIEVAHVYSSNELVNFVFTKDKKFLLGDYPLNFEKNGKFTLAKLSFDLDEYNINIDDKFNNKKISLKGDYLKDAVYIKDDKFQFATNGKFFVNDKFTPYFMDVAIDLPLKDFNDHKLKIKSDIKDFDLSAISDYMPYFTNGLIQSTKGILNLKSDTKMAKYGHKFVAAKLTTKDLGIYGKDKPSSIVYPELITLKANFETIERGINFKNTLLETDDVHIKLDGKLSASGKKVPKMNFTVDIKPSKLEKACKLMPWLRKVPREMDFYKFKEYGVYGKGEGNLHFIGHGDRPEVYGFVKLYEAYILQKGLIAPQGAKIDLKFLGKIMNIDVFVPVDAKQNVTVKGTAKIDGSRYSELDIKSTDAINMEPAQKVLNPLHEMLKFKIGPVPIMKLKGFGAIDVKSRGKKIDPHLFGKMTFRNATAEFNDIHNLTLYNGSGEILFQDRDVPFKTFSATINGQDASIYGKCNVFGDLDVYAVTKNQDIPKMIKVINTSKDMAEVQEVIKPFTKPDGKGDLYLNIYGNAQDVTKVVFNEDLFAKGKVVFHNATTLLQDTFIPFENINGYVNFDKKDANYDVTGYIKDAKINVKGTAHDKDIDLAAISDKMAIINILDMMYPDMVLPLKKEIGKLYVSFVGKYKGIAKDGKLDYDKVIVDGKILPNMSSNYPIRIKNTPDFNIRHSALSANNIVGYFGSNPFTLSFTGTDIYDKMKIKDAVFDFSNFDIASVNEIKNQIELPYEYKAILDDIDNIKGSVDIKGEIKNGGIYSDTDLRDINFTYKPLDAPVSILSGKANMRGDSIYLSKINTKASSMPVFLNGSISNIFKNPYINMYLTGKFNQEFFDRFVNAKSVYPVKLKGDSNFTSKVTGRLNNLRTVSSLKVKENSSIYYMGATLAGAPSGMTTADGAIATNPVEINLDANISPDRIKINELNYNQTISSQNKKASVQKQLAMSGAVTLLKNNILKFDNLRIKTFEPTDAKIFNILLKKPTIKQGIFTTDLLINGTSLKPHPQGNLNITSVDVPLFDATIRDIDINFSPEYIDLISKGVILTNDINLTAKILNNPVVPYVIEDFKLQTDVLDLNVIAGRFNDYDTDKLRGKKSDSDLIITPDQIIIKNGEIIADKILIKKAQATDFNAHVFISDDHILHIDKYTFNLANGTIDGNIESNLSTMESKANMNINDADAEIISENFFDMPGQMYGRVTGNLSTSFKGSNSIECLKTLSGEGQFNVTDGRMPKLGSLEYLLKAANLVTGGLTGVSINGIIDLITPLKTGNFDKISGNVIVKNGVANDIKVYSSGKELNMYLTGKYDLTNLNADMEIYGSLSKNFSTLLGRIGNMSLNRLLNSIPGISINDINPESTSNINKIPNFNKDNTLRVFKAEIFGDINGSNYVKSFRWIKH